MKITKRILIILPVICCVLCVGSNILIEHSRFGYHPVDDLEPLLIDEKDIPAGWAFDYKSPITGDYDYGEKNVVIVYSRGPGKGYMHQYVYHFSNSFAADYSYNFLKMDKPVVRDNKIQYANYTSPIADRWFLACDLNNSGGIMCDTVSRYDDFIISLSFTCANDQFTPEQLVEQVISVLESIDKRMARLID